MQIHEILQLSTANTGAEIEQLALRVGCGQDDRGVVLHFSKAFASVLGPQNRLFGG